MHGFVYTNIPGSCQMRPRPQRTWSAEAISAPQDGFEHTDWRTFRKPAVNGVPSSVTSYMNKCTSDVSISKTITSCSIQELGKTVEVRKLSEEP